MTKREDLRLQGDTGSKTGGDQSEKGNKKRAHRDTTRISRMLGTTAFSARTEFSVTTSPEFHHDRARNTSAGVNDWNTAPPAGLPSLPSEIIARTHQPLPRKKGCRFSTSYSP